jgi:hypothetical protein
MRIGNIEVSDEWEDGASFICCRNFTGETFRSCIFISRLDVSLNTHFIHLLGFPYIEYITMFGDSAKFRFDSLKEAQDHVDRFLIRLERLMVFL